MKSDADQPAQKRRVKAGPKPILPSEPRDLRPHYSNSAMISHSPYEFIITFLRSDHLFDSPDTTSKETAPVGVATRVAMSHLAMKEFLDAAIANYEKLRAQDPGLPELKVSDEHADD